MALQFHAYRSSYKESVLDIFKSNCPKYFDLDDLPELVYFLNEYADDNFKVVMFDEQVIGCGGHYVKNEHQTIGIAWVMFKRFSLGRRNFNMVADDFFEHILESIRNENLNYDIIINTTQLLEKTFVKYDFTTEQIIKEGFGNNLDHYRMRRKWAT